MDQIKLYKGIRSKLPSLSPLRALYTALMAPRDESGALLIEDTTPLFEGTPIDVAQYLFKLNLEKTKKTLSIDKNTTSIFLHPGSWISQILPLAEALYTQGKYNYLTIIPTEYIVGNSNNEDTFNEQYALGTLMKMEAFAQFNVFIIPTLETLQDLTFLDIVFAQEGRVSKEALMFLPRHTHRVTLPHGTDVPFTYTFTSGGGIFNYILCSNLNHDFEPDLYLNMLPKELIRHSSSEICAIPAGYPKIDRFVRLFSEQKNKTPKHIVYHLSNWELEEDIVKENLENTIQILLDSFVDWNLVIRPMLSDITRPEIRKAIDRFADNPRFIVSRGQDYTSDYLEAALLIAHRGSSPEVFTYSTGRPTIWYNPRENFNNTEVIEAPLGYQCHTEEQLLTAVSMVLENPDSQNDRLFTERDRQMENPGRTCEYIIDTLPYILENRHHPDWKYFSLYDKDETISLKDQCIRSCEKAIAGQYVWRWLGDAVVNTFPNDPLCLLYGSLANMHEVDTNPYYTATDFTFRSKALAHVIHAIRICHNNNLFDSVYTRILTWYVIKGIKMVNDLFNLLRDNRIHSHLNNLTKAVSNLHKIPTFQENLNAIILQDDTPRNSSIWMIELQGNLSEGIKQDLAQTKNQLGTMLFKENNPGEAVKCFSRCLDFDPTNGDFLFNSAVALEKCMRYEEALEQIIRLIKLEPSNPNAWGVWCTILSAHSASDIFNTTIDALPEELLSNENLLNLFLQIAQCYNSEKFAKRLLPRAEISPNQTIRKQARELKNALS